MKRQILYISLLLNMLVIVLALGILALEGPQIYCQAFDRLILSRLPSSMVEQVDPASYLNEPQMPFHPELRLSLSNVSLESASDVIEWQELVRDKAKELLSLDTVGLPSPVVIAREAVESGSERIIERLLIPSPFGYDNIIIYRVSPATDPSLGSVIAIPGSGKNGVAGLVGWLNDYHRSAALELADAGYTVYVPETFGVRERAIDVAWLADYGVTSVVALGQYGVETGQLLSSVYIGDLLSVVEYVKADNGPQSPIATFGISRGGVLAYWAAALHPDVSAVVIASGISDHKNYSWTGFSQVLIPCSLRYFNRSDIAAAIAPRPMLITYGGSSENQVYSAESVTLTTYNRVSQVYELLGVPQNIRASVHDEGHTWDREATLAFLGSVFSSKSPGVEAE